MAERDGAADELTLVDGVLGGVRCVASPNCDERPAGTAVSLIVIHAISLPPGQFGGTAVEALFTNRLAADAHPYYRDIHALRLSAHFFIERSGRITQFVPCDRRAWHAGVSSWRGRPACNDFSIGIELEGCDQQAFAEAQYQALEPLLRALHRAYPINDVVGHSDVAPGRKTDPGPHFDWARLRRHSAP